MGLKVKVPALMHSEAAVLTVMKGELNVPLAPNKLGPFKPLHCALEIKD